MRCLITALALLTIGPTGVLAQDMTFSGDDAMGSTGVVESSETESEEASTGSSGLEPLKPPEGQIAVQGVIGPAFAVENFRNFGVQHQLKLGAEGLYFLDKVGNGLAIGGAFHVGFVDFESMQIVARGGWAIPILPEIYVMPHLSMGFAYLFLPFGQGRAAFDLGFGADAVASFGPFFAFVRPFHFDFFFEGNTLARYDLLFGGGASF